MILGNILFCSCIRKVYTTILPVLQLSWIMVYLLLVSVHMREWRSTGLSRTGTNVTIIALFEIHFTMQLGRALGNGRIHHDEP